MKENFLIGENATLGIFDDDGNYDEMDLTFNEKYKVNSEEFEKLKYTGFDDKYLIFETEDNQEIMLKIKNIRSIEQV